MDLRDEAFYDLIRQISGKRVAELLAFQECNGCNPILAKSYFIVNINGTKKYLHKQTAAWILSNDKSTLSSDRLKRVMTNK
jgi:hypothetical protein